MLRLGTPIVAIKREGHRVLFKGADQVLVRLFERIAWLGLLGLLGCFSFSHATKDNITGGCLARGGHA